MTEITDDAVLDHLAEAIVQTAADAILATDRDGIISFWNPGAVRIFGFTVEQALGQSLDIIIPANQRQRHWDGWERVMQTGHSRYGLGQLLSVPALTVDGRRISVEFSITLIHEADGSIAGMAAVLRDVTVRFEEHRALQRRAAELERLVVAAAENK